MSRSLQTISSNLTKQSERDRVTGRNHRRVLINFQKNFLPSNIHIYIYKSKLRHRPTSRKQQAALERSLEWKLKQLETVRFPFN